MGEGEFPEIMVLRDRPLAIVGWVLGVGCAVGAIAAAFAGSASGVVVLGAVAAWCIVMRITDIPRVELYHDRLIIRSFSTTVVPYDDIVGVHIGTRWWAGRSALVLERGYDHVTAVPAGAGLNVPRWHLQLRDEINRRTDVELL
ncbi:MAG: hypothetical protein QNJ88_17330 [Acidimicrobiia bacterium]|nr:hypothetical protein [Acidimicrobiia bacterium]